MLIPLIEFIIDGNTVHARRWQAIPRVGDTVSIGQSLLIVEDVFWCDVEAGGAGHTIGFYHPPVVRLYCKKAVGPAGQEYG